LGVFLPLHPLLAEARQYAARPETARYFEDLYVALPWLPTLGKDPISQLRCGEGQVGIAAVYGAPWKLENKIDSAQIFIRCRIDVRSIRPVYVRRMRTYL